MSLIVCGEQRASRTLAWASKISILRIWVRKFLDLMSSGGEFKVFIRKWTLLLDHIPKKVRCKNKSNASLNFNYQVKRTIILFFYFVYLNIKLLSCVIYIFTYCIRKIRPNPQSLPHYFIRKSGPWTKNELFLPPNISSAVVIILFL
jgi:hypothetical protein